MTESDNPAGTSTVDVTIADHFHPERTIARASSARRAWPHGGSP